MSGDAAMQTVHSSPDHEREQNPDAVVKKDADCSRDVAAAVLLQVGKQWAQTLGQHVLE